MDLIVFSKQINIIKSRGKLGFIILGIMIWLALTWLGRLLIKYTWYFSPGNPKNISSEGLLRKVVGPDTATIGRLAVYKGNSRALTKEAALIGENPYGLKKMSGNVYELCSDFYEPDACGSDIPEIAYQTGPEREVVHVRCGWSYFIAMFCIYSKRVK